MSWRTTWTLRRDAVCFISEDPEATHPQAQLLLDLGKQATTAGIALRKNVERTSRASEALSTTLPVASSWFPRMQPGRSQTPSSPPSPLSFRAELRYSNSACFSSERSITTLTNAQASQLHGCDCLTTRSGIDGLLLRRCKRYTDTVAL